MNKPSPAAASQFSTVNSQLPRGYKQTEVGVIPEDWEVMTASEIFIKIQDGTHFSPLISKRGDFLYITSKNIKYGTLDLEKIEYIEEAEHNKIYKRCDVQTGDILLTKDGANTGNAALNTIPDKFSLLSSVAFLRVHSSSHIAEFFLQQILSRRFQRKIQEEMSGNAITRLTLRKINKLSFAVPTKAEQEAIAGALSDADEWIAALTRLIAKKRQIKQATMQTLLTGQTRLPEFDKGQGYKQTELGEIPEDWDVDPLSEYISALNAGVSVNSVDEEQGVCGHQEAVLKTSCISGGYFYPEESKKILPKDVHRAKLNPKNNSIIISRMNTPALVGECGYIASDYPYLFLPDRLWQASFKADSSIDARWLAYILSFGQFLQAIKDTATGTSGSMKNITKDGLLGVKIPLPPTKAEQTAIATILSDMDAQIAALEGRLDKARDIKQGMMSELLTGKTRLI